MPLLEVKNLFKNYKKIEAVKGVSFSLEEGTCFGLLGPNGAGKTTVIEMIEDVISPASGEILYQGKPRTSSFKKKIGIQFQETTLLTDLTVRETLETFSQLYDQPADLEVLIDQCNLKDFQKQMNDKISGGQKQRFLLALALVNKPKLIFLDEPSTGLDPQARRNLWDIVSKIKQDGKTIILTTHYMEEAEYLCDVVAIMDEGKIIAQGSPDELIKKHGGDVRIVLPKGLVQPYLSQLSFPYRENHETVDIQTSDSNACLKQLMSLDINLTDMIIRSQNLESVFLNLTGRHLRE